MKKMVHNTVQEFRKERKMTQEELAQALGVSRQTVSALEKGNYTPSVALALHVAEIFNTSVHEIFKLDL